MFQTPTEMNKIFCPTKRAKTILFRVLKMTGINIMGKWLERKRFVKTLDTVAPSEYIGLPQNLSV